MAIYQKAEIEIVFLSETDLIATSGGNHIGKDDSSNDAEWID